MTFGLLSGTMFGDWNLLLNPEFQFSSFDNSRSGIKEEFRTGSVPFWDQESYGAAEVYRAPRVAAFRPRFPVEGIVKLRPGETMRQFALLSEMQLDHGDTVSLSVFGYQTKPNALRANIAQMQLDNATGSWSPKDIGQADARTFPKHARGELVRVEVAGGTSGAGNEFELKIEKALISGAFKEEPKQSDDLANTIGVQVEFTNTSDQEVWIYAPCLTKGDAARNRLPALRSLPDHYRYIPKTIAKLRRGEPLHFITMGSSIDRGSANPPLYLYDEDPASPHFKEPISKADMLFDGAAVGHSEWTPYFGQWRHYFSYTGRLRRSLMRRYDYSADKLLLNFMACDGSSIGESHTALQEWSSLSLPLSPEGNGNPSGATWQSLYPALFARPQGPVPDLVIFGSGANEKIDGADEIAAFEGAIRWFQRHYPEVEFIFCMWQNRESYTPNTGMLKELSLRYGIPMVDMGREFSLVTRHVNSYALTPSDGHPQAAAHYLWGHLLESAFQSVDPIAPGVPQQYLPARASIYTTGWEGEMRTYGGDSPRIHQGTAFILDDTALNLWASGDADTLVEIRIDGLDPKALPFSNESRRKPVTARTPRNSTFAIGRLTLGDQHIVEVQGNNAKILAVDAKTALNRVWHGIESMSWQKTAGSVQPFASQWGAPYGSAALVLKAGEKTQLEWVGTDCSVAWASAQGGGTLVARVDGDEKLRMKSSEPVPLASGEPIHMENRKGILNLPYGLHRLEVEAQEGPVTLLGAFSYDTRPNRSAERTLQGVASPGDVITFSAPYKATPLVICSGGLKPRSVDREKAIFEGAAPGSYQVIGE